MDVVKQACIVLPVLALTAAAVLGVAMMMIMTSWEVL